MSRKTSLQRRKNITPVPGVLNNQKQLAPQRPLIQAKLTIGQPNDKYEQEADRVADAVMLTTQPKVQHQSDGKEDDEEVVQTKVSPNHTLELRPGLESNINGMKGSGQPLDSETRAFMEPRFGHDFSQVRVHDDAKAAESAQAVNALAYTLGKDVVFGAGQYAPKTVDGKRLLAHELAHTIQQTEAKKIQRQEKYNYFASSTSMQRRHVPKVILISNKELEALSSRVPSHFESAGLFALSVGVATFGPDPSDVIVVPLMFLLALMGIALLQNIYVISEEELDRRMRERLGDRGLEGRTSNELKEDQKHIKANIDAIENGLKKIPPGQEPEDPDRVQKILNALRRWLDKIGKELQERIKEGSFRPRKQNEPWKK